MNEDERVGIRLGRPKMPLVTKKEIRAWKIWDFGSHSISSVIISGFLPLIVQEIALKAAGHPDICPNYRYGHEYVHQLFPTEDMTQRYDSVFLYNADPSMIGSNHCVVGALVDGILGTWCGGIPSLDECVQASGNPDDKYRMSVGGWNPAAFSNTMTSIAVALQMLVFVQLGALADYGNGKKILWMSSSVLTCLVVSLIISLDDTQWQLAGTLLVLVAILYNTSLMLYNSYLPILAMYSPDVVYIRKPGPGESIDVETIEASYPTYEMTSLAPSQVAVYGSSDAATLQTSAMEQDTGTIGTQKITWLEPKPEGMDTDGTQDTALGGTNNDSHDQNMLRYKAKLDELSNSGFLWGFCGSVTCLGVSLVIAIVMKGTLLSYKIDCLVAGIFFFSFALYSFAVLRARQGPRIPEGDSYFTLPWKRLFTTVKDVKRLPTTFRFLILWFIYSDGFNVIGHVGAVYANTSVVWNPIPKSVGVSMLLLIVPIFAIIGNKFFGFLSKRNNIPALKVVQLNLFLLCLVPAYGLIGFLHDSLGYRKGWELYIGVAMYG